jgi:hypothetical protein
MVEYKHCKEDSNYVFPEIKMRGLVLVPNYYVYIYPRR